MKNVLSNLREELISCIDEKTRESSQNYFREKICFYGVNTALVGKLGKKYFESIKDNSKKEIFSLCDQLWQSGYIEESFIACNWSYYIHTKYEPEDFLIFENWISEYVNNWASCDTLCNHTVGQFLEMYPVFISRLKNFAKSDNRWMRRASAVTLIIPARKGKFLKEILELADILLIDKDDLVQKGYGWMLKATSEAHQQEVFDYVMKNKAIMPRTPLRYAIEKMPRELKEAAMVR